MTGTLRRRTPAFRLPALLPALLAGAVLSAPAAGADSKPSKLERQISVMEKIIDEMLIESPNFLVRGSHETRGFEMEDYGAVFMFDASLTGVWWDEDSGLSRFNFWPFRGGKNRTIVVNKADGKQKEIIINGEKLVIREGAVFVEDEDGDLKKLEDGEGKALSRKELEERQAQKYERAKQELIDVMLECGGVLRALPAGQTVKIVAHLDDMDLPKDREIGRLTLQAKIDDLRSYADDQLSEEQMRARIQIKES